MSSFWFGFRSWPIVMKGKPIDLCFEAACDQQRIPHGKSHGNLPQGWHLQMDHRFFKNDVLYFFVRARHVAFSGI